MDERTWTDRPLLEGEIIQVGSVSIHIQEPKRVLMISGQIEAALASILPDATPVGFCGETGDSDYAVQMARDRILVVTTHAQKTSIGWHEAGYAVSDVSSLYAVFELSGDGVRDILNQGTSTDLESSSLSAAIEFAGQSALLIKQDAVYKLYVETSTKTYISSFLRTCAIAGNC